MNVAEQICKGEALEGHTAICLQLWSLGEQDYYVFFMFHVYMFLDFFFTMNINNFWYKVFI